MVAVTASSSHNAILVSEVWLGSCFWLLTPDFSLPAGFCSPCFLLQASAFCIRAPEF
jgi:hypothetical protein